jgi:hypothetical protein
LNKLSLISFFLFTGLAFHAQVLLPTPESAFEQQHNFNSDLIRKKGIRKITYEIIDKKDFEVAVDKSLTETYEFNGDGKLSRYYYTNIIRSIEKQYTKVGRKGRSHTYTVNEYVYDTVSTSYFYSGPNLVLKRYHDGMSYYESRYYRYDDHNDLTRELRYKETNNSSDRSVFILGNQVLLSEDSFQYVRYSSGQVKCICLNNENRPYKERIVNFDSLGRKRSVSENYTAASWIMQEQKFEYSAGRLSAATFEGNANNRVIMRNTYEYDAAGELYTEKQYRNEQLIREISYVTDRSNGLLNSFIIRDPLNKTMRIVKLRYDMGMIGKASGKQI